MDADSKNQCLLCGEEFNGNGDVATPNRCQHVFHLVCIKTWADIKINVGQQVLCPIESCLKPFDSVGVKKNATSLKTLNVIPVDQDWNCSICFNPMNQVNEIGNPEVCNHHFCLSCLLEWSQTNTSCPLDRLEFQIIFVKNAVGGTVQRTIHTPQRDRRTELADAETEDTEDDVEVGMQALPPLEIPPFFFTGHDSPSNIHMSCSICSRRITQDVARCSNCNLLFHYGCIGTRRISETWRCATCRPRRQPNSRNQAAAAPARTRSAPVRQSSRLSLRRMQRRQSTVLTLFNLFRMFPLPSEYRSSEDSTVSSLATEDASTDLTDSDSSEATAEAIQQPPSSTQRAYRGPRTRGAARAATLRPDSASAPTRRSTRATRSRPEHSIPAPAVRPSRRPTRSTLPDVLHDSSDSDYEADEPVSPADGRQSRASRRRPASLRSLDSSVEADDNSASDSSDSSSDDSNATVQRRPAGNSRRRQRSSSSDDDDDDDDDGGEVESRPPSKRPCVRYVFDSDSDNGEPSVSRVSRVPGSTPERERRQRAANAQRHVATEQLWHPAARFNSDESSSSEAESMSQLDEAVAPRRRGGSRRAVAAAASANIARMLEAEDREPSTPVTSRLTAARRRGHQSAEPSTAADQPTTSSGRRASNARGRPKSASKRGKRKRKSAKKSPAKGKKTRGRRGRGRSEASRVKSGSRDDSDETVRSESEDTVPAVSANQRVRSHRRGQSSSQADGRLSPLSRTLDITIRSRFGIEPIRPPVDIVTTWLGRQGRENFASFFDSDSSSLHLQPTCAAVSSPSTSSDTF